MDNLNDLFKNKRIIEVPKSRIVVYEGHDVNRIYRIVSGFIKVYTIAGANAQRVVFIYKPGDIFPLTTFLSGESVTRFFYETMTPASVQYITPKQLENKLKGNLQLGIEMIGYTGYLDRLFLDRVNSMVSTKDPLSKIKALLQSFCDRLSTRGSIVTLDIPLSHRIIASMCGISVQEAIKQMRFLKSERVIFSDDGVKIDRQKLKKL
jgi:CRP-like cAMP-binding protein